MKKTNRRNNILERGGVVYIRFPEIDDCDEYIRLNRASIKLYKGLISPTITKESFLKYISRCGQSDFKGFFICRKQDDAIVGAINLSQIFMAGFKSAYMGYRVGAPFAGQGYMTLGMDLVLRYAFNKMKLHRLEANVQPENKPSIALLNRSGFTKEGFSRRYLKISGKWRDHERWAILAEDWGKKH